MRTVWRLPFTQDVGVQLRKCRNILTKTYDKHITRDCIVVGTSTRHLPHWLATTITLLERACPRWYRWGASTFAVFVSQASLLQQGRGSACGSGLARDGIGAVPVILRCMHRRQACSNRAAVQLVGAGLPARVSARCQYLRGACIAGKPAPTGPRFILWERACPRWYRWSASTFAVFVSQASLLQQGRGPSCGSGLARDGIGGVPGCGSSSCPRGYRWGPVPSRCLYRRQACSNRARFILWTCPRLHPRQAPQGRPKRKNPRFTLNQVRTTGLADAL